MGSSSRTISTAKRRSFPPRPSKLENTFSRPEQSRLFLIALTNSSAYLVFAVSVSLFSGFHDRLQVRPPFPPTTLGFWGTVSHATFYTIPLDRITTKLLAAFRFVRQVDNRLGEKSRTHNAQQVRYVISHFLSCCLRCFVQTIDNHRLIIVVDYTRRTLRSDVEK